MMFGSYFLLPICVVLYIFGSGAAGEDELCQSMTTNVTSGGNLTIPATTSLFVCNCTGTKVFQICPTWSILEESQGVTLKTSSGSSIGFDCTATIQFNLTSDFPSSDLTLRCSASNTTMDYTFHVVAPQVPSGPLENHTSSNTTKSPPNATHIEATTLPNPTTLENLTSQNSTANVEGITTGKSAGQTSGNGTSTDSGFGLQPNFAILFFASLLTLKVAFYR